MLGQYRGPTPFIFPVNSGDKSRELPKISCVDCVVYVICDGMFGGQKGRAVLIEKGTGLISPNEGRN